MSDRPGVYSRIQRRETHASRSVPAIVVAVVLILALAYLVAEILLAALQQPALLATPTQMVAGIAALSTVAVVWLVVAGVVLALLGIVLLVAALSSGRRPRRVLRDERAVIVVDDEVIASALVRTAADTGNVDPDRAVGSVSRRTAVVRITPTSGVPLDRDAIGAALGSTLEGWDMRPALRARVRLQDDGKVGA